MELYLNVSQSLVISLEDLDTIVWHEVDPEHQLLFLFDVLRAAVRTGLFQLAHGVFNGIVHLEGGRGKEKKREKVREMQKK